MIHAFSAILSFQLLALIFFSRLTLEKTMTAPQGEQPQLTFEDLIKDLPLHMAVLTSPPEMGVQMIHKAMSANPKPSINRVDNYGRTAFHLALGLNNLEAAKALLAYNPRVDIQDNEGFTAWDEVVITKDEELIKSVFKFQETDRLLAVLKGIGHTFASFAAVPDFYYELKWSITGLPLISKFIAHDTYKVYKKGHSVRIDSTLVDIKEGRILYKPITGERSFIFLATELGATTFIDMDHQAQTYTKIAYEGDDSQVMKVVVENEDAFEEALSQKDVTSTRIISEGLHAKVAKSFLTRKQKQEVVDGLPCVGYDVHGVMTELKTRRESLLGQLATALEIKGDPLKYFSAKSDEEKAAADLVPSRNVQTTLKSWDATVYMYEGGGGYHHYPYSIEKHLVPVLKLMALINPQFAKLASFLSLDIFTDRPGAVTADPGEKLDKIRKLPGFPLVIDMHVFMNIKARISVQNHTADGVEDICAGPGGKGLLLDPKIFAIPTNYAQVN